MIWCDEHSHTDSGLAAQGACGILKTSEKRWCATSCRCICVKIGNWEVTYFNRVPPCFIRGNILCQDLQRREKLAFLRNSRKIIMRKAEEWGMNKNWVFMWVQVKSGRVSLSHIGELREFQFWECFWGVWDDQTWALDGPSAALWWWWEDENEAKCHDEFAGSSKYGARKKPCAVKGRALASDRSESQPLLCYSYSMCPLNFRFSLSKMRITIVLPNKDVVKIKWDMWMHITFLAQYLMLR